ncbi:MAG TPA: hypothetical protein VFN31_01225 [Candidatus Saccharimonadales bacterium]|nr:hypothetical protein [Candidatus Saccharimonadales bacterium]
MNLDPKNILKVIVVAVVLVLLIFGVNAFINSTNLNVVSTDPSLDNFSNAVPFLDVNFNKTLIPKSVSISSRQNIISSYKVSGKTIYIDLNLLFLNRTYTITINHAESNDKKTISNKDLTFTTVYINPSDLPANQQKAILNHQDNYSSPLNDPLVAHLPYQTLNYILSSQIENGKDGKPTLAINANILLNQSQMADEASSITQIKQEINDYISSFGLNPANYNIQYTVTTP